MEAPLTLRILYTYNIRGNLAWLPRLYTVLAAHSHDDIIDRTVKVDLGEACAGHVWHCAETDGRSALLALDAMGFAAARVSLSPASRERLVGNALAIAPVDEAHPHQDGALRYTAALTPPPPECRLQIALVPAEETRLDEGALSLATVAPPNFGVVDVFIPQMGVPIIRTAQQVAVAADTPPNPSIVAAVDFIEAEARYYASQKKTD